MSWVDAIKEYAKQNGGKFVIPKRDSEDYGKVKAIQERMAKGEKIEVPKAKKEKPVKKANVVVEVKEEVVEQPRKTTAKRGEKKANIDVPAPVAVAVEEPVKKVRKSIPKPEKRANVVEAVMPSTETAPVKVKKEKPVKKANVVVTQEAVVVADAPKAPKKSVKEQRLEKEAVKSKESEEKATVRAKRALIDARMRMINTPVTLDFN
jgi:hypothetical protein